MVYCEIWPQEKLKKSASLRSNNSVNHKERHKYRHRVNQIAEIEEYIQEIFGIRSSINYYDFIELTKKKSAELFCAAMILLH